MISELLRSGLDVLVTGGTAATEAANQATSTVPIVGINLPDPVGSGLVQSLARPGGNVTALSQGGEWVGKILEFLRQIVPTLSRIGFVYNPEVDSHVRIWQQISSLAAASGLHAVPAQVPTPADLIAAVERLIADGAEAFIDIFNNSAEGDAPVAALALSHHVVCAGIGSSFPAAGGLLSYGPDVIAEYRRAGYYVDRILKGAKPADLPVETPTTFNLVVNQAIARALGVTIPDEVAQQVTSWI